MGDDARIWIGGLPDGIEEQEIKDEYERFGEIEHVHLRCNKGSPAFAFVQFNDRRNAEDAVKSTDQAKLFGMPFVKVSWAGKGAPRGKGKGKGRPSRTPSRRRGSPRRPSPDRRGPAPRRDSRQRARSPPPQRHDSRPRPRSAPPRRDSRARARSPMPARRDSRQRPRSPPARREPSRDCQRSPPRNGSRRDFPREERPPERQQSRSQRRQSSYQQRSSSPGGGGGGGYRSPRQERSRTPPAPRGGRQPKPSELQGKYRVKIEKLPEDMGWQELKGLGVTFAKSGQCTFARTLRDRTGVLEFTSVTDMNRAIDELDGRRFSGSETRVIAFEDKTRR